MTRFFYFAYGSNMLTARLKARCTSAVPDGIAVAPGYSISYCQMSGDGSAKAGLVPQAGARATGVLFSIDESEIDTLDRFEGIKSGAFRRAEIEVNRRSADKTVRVITYFPQLTALPPVLLPIPDHDEPPP